MKRGLLIVTAFLLLIPSLMSQKVDSIKVEQAGDFVKISYRLLNSSIYQVYNVRIMCSMEGGLKTELRSVTGDVGDEVLGGKKEYVVLWDVLKDVSELKSVEFFVRAELAKDNSKANLSPDEILKDRKLFFLAGLGSNGKENFLMGLRFAYMNSWGFSARMLAGPAPFDNDADLGRYLAISSGLDLTKSIIRNPGFQLHLLAGFSILRSEPYGPVNNAKLFFTWNGGIIIAVKRAAFCVSVSPVEAVLENGGNSFPEFGVGLRF